MNIFYSKKSEVSQEHIDNNEWVVYCGRGSILGNPYTHLKLNDTKAEHHVPNRVMAIVKYEKHFLKQFKEDEVFRKHVSNMFRMHDKHNKLELICYCETTMYMCHTQFIEKFLRQNYNYWRSLPKDENGFPISRKNRQ